MSRKLWNLGQLFTKFRKSTKSINIWHDKPCPECKDSIQTTPFIIFSPKNLLNFPLSCNKMPRLWWTNTQIGASFPLSTHFHQAVNLIHFQFLVVTNCHKKRILPTIKIYHLFNYSRQFFSSLYIYHSIHSLWNFARNHLDLLNWIIFLLEISTFIVCQFVDS